MVGERERERDIYIYIYRYGQREMVNIEARGKW